MEGPRTKLDAHQMRVTEPNGFRTKFWMGPNSCLAYGLRFAQVAMGIDDINGGEITYAGPVPTNFDHKSLQSA